MLSASRHVGITHDPGNICKVGFRRQTRRPKFTSEAYKSKDDSHIIFSQQGFVVSNHPQAESSYLSSEPWPNQPRLQIFLLLLQLCKVFPMRSPS